MIRCLLETALVIFFVRYERLTGILFKSMACRDGLYPQKEAARLWLDFDTTSAPAVKGFIRLLEQAYGIDWRGLDPSLKRLEKKARRIRSDIIHAKGRYLCVILLQSLGTVRKLHRERKKILNEFKEKRCSMDTQSMRREISRLVDKK